MVTGPLLSTPAGLSVPCSFLHSCSVAIQQHIHGKPNLGKTCFNIFSHIYSVHLSLKEGALDARVSSPNKDRSALSCGARSIARCGAPVTAVLKRLQFDPKSLLLNDSYLFGSKDRSSRRFTHSYRLTLVSPATRVKNYIILFLCN